MEPRPLFPDKSRPGNESGGGGDGTDGDMHLTTFTHEGRFWEVYLEFVEVPDAPDSGRARLCYVPSDRADHEEPVRTAVIIIEPSRAEARAAARALERYHLAAMLRSVT